MTPSLLQAPRLLVNLPGFAHKVLDGVKNEPGRRRELPVHSGAPLKTLPVAPGEVSWGDFVSVKTLWISSLSHEDLQVC